VYPLDVLKTRMQVAPNRWPTSFDCARDALATGGVADLYSGLGAQLLGVAPEKSLKAGGGSGAMHRLCALPFIATA
jgi:solute carrier family 25 (mitochondrial aspartate/glutamate transporter), member 12/13